MANGKIEIVKNKNTGTLKESGITQETYLKVKNQSARVQSMVIAMISMAILLGFILMLYHLVVTN